MTVARTDAQVRTALISGIVGLALGPGKVFYVNSSASNDASSGAGFSWTKPLTSIDTAIGLCTANRGDTILVGPGHTETITAADGINCDIAGITIIGIGTGSLKPTISFSTATTATFGINADNVTIRNLRFVSAIDSLVQMVDVDNEYATIEDCDFVGPAGLEFLNGINLATTKDNFWIRRCKFLQGADPAGTDGGADTGCIYCVDSENIYIEDCEAYGNFETAFLHNKTTAAKNVWVVNCRGQMSLSSSVPFELVAGCTGGAFGGMFLTPAEAAVTEATLVGTLGDGFFISPTCTFGNDGAAGGQGGIIVATAS